jgi:hypothetical protein
MAPPIVETRWKIVNVVGKLSMLSEFVKFLTGVGGEDLKCCRPENFLVCLKKFSVCRNSIALGPPKNMGPTAPLVDRFKWKWKVTTQKNAYSSHAVACKIRYLQIDHAPFAAR